MACQGLHSLWPAPLCLFQDALLTGPLRVFSLLFLSVCVRGRACYAAEEAACSVQGRVCNKVLELGYCTSLAWGGAPRGSQKPVGQLS